MKKVISSVIGVIALMTLIACGGGGTPPPADKNTTIPEQNTTLSAEEIAQLVEKAYGLDQAGLAGEEAMVHLVTHIPLKRGETRVADGQSSDMFGGDSQSYWDGGKMAEGDVPFGYFYQSGYRGTIKANTGIPNHWDYYQINYPDVGSDYNVTYLNFGSDGLYDVNVWNININPSGWVRYNTMAQFHPYEGGGGRHILMFSSIYNQDWDGTENDRSIYGIHSALWVSGPDGEGGSVETPNFTIHKVFVQEYTMPDGTVLDNCLVGEFSNYSRGLRENDEDSLIKTTTVIHLGYDHGLTGDVLKYFKEINQHGHGVVKVFIEAVDLGT